MNTKIASINNLYFLNYNKRKTINSPKKLKNLQVFLSKSKTILFTLEEKENIFFFFVLNYPADTFLITLNKFMETD